MATYAVMSGITVENIIIGDDKEETEVALNCKLIEYTDENPAGIGWVYDETANKFVAPIVAQILDPSNGDINANI